MKIKREDLPTPAVSKVNKKETEKLIKYKDLENEVIRIWKERTKILQVIFGALAIIKQGLDQSLSSCLAAC
jgi:hypothetical protein